MSKQNGWRSAHKGSGLSRLFAMLLVLGSTSCAHAQPPVANTQQRETSAWSVTNSAETGPVMKRNAGAAIAELHLVGDEYNMFTPTLQLSVAGCGAAGWSVSDSVSPVGKDAAARGLKVRDVLVQQFAKARQSCSLGANVEAEILAGFEGAYLQFEAIRQ